MSDDVDDLWNRWLAWVEANAPASRAEIRPPAAADELARVRAGFDRPWPADLVRLYQLCDGTTGDSRWGADLFPLTPVVPLGYVLGTAEMRLEVSREFPSDPDAEPETDSVTAEIHDVWEWSPRYVPFADDISGDGFFIDLRDGPAYGSVGRWLHADNRTAAVWPSLTAALARIVDAVENRTAFDGWIPGVDDEGRIEWEPSGPGR